MEILATDLDQTLIYGDGSVLGPEPLLVEEKDGVPITYMSAFAAQTLRQITHHAWVVPLTTRSLEQYQRIAFPGLWVPDYALVANGAILLEGGLRDEAWYRDTLTLIAPAEEALAQGAELLQTDPNLTLSPRKVDGVFWFAKSREPEETLRRLRPHLDPHAVTLMRHGGKIYIMPRNLHKGRALCRLRERLAVDRVFCAGDSEFDISMLEEGDLSFAPRALVERYGLFGSNVIALSGERPFSDLMLGELHQLLDEAAIAHH